MKYNFQLYYLYCMNIQCKASLYWSMAELQIPSTAKKWVGIYTCSCCNQQLIAAVDTAMGFEQEEIDSKKPKKQDYLRN